RGTRYRGRPMRRPLFLFALLASSGSLAQTSALTSLDPARTAELPPTGAALADEAYAAAVNPAGLVHATGVELNYIFERSVARTQTVNGLFLSHSSGTFAQALTANWIRGAQSSRRLSWDLALGSEAIALGVDVHWLSSDVNPFLDGMASFDVGIMSRPLPFVAFGIVAHNVDQPTRG